jgi:hypothetical protein
VQFRGSIGVSLSDAAAATFIPAFLLYGCLFSPCDFFSLNNEVPIDYPRIVGAISVVLLQKESKVAEAEVVG